MGNYYETFLPPYFPYRTKSNLILKLNSSSYDRDDHKIVEDLSLKLKTLHGIDASQVSISSEFGEINLVGNVLSREVKEFLGHVAENILGVRSVRNSLEVARMGAPIELNDAENFSHNLSHHSSKDLSN